MKATPVSRILLKKHNVVLVHTGQYYDYSVSRVSFKELGIHWPEVNLAAALGHHGRQMVQMLIGIEKALFA